jgi:hypothetical protein
LLRRTNKIHACEGNASCLLQELSNVSPLSLDMQADNVAPSLR